MPTDANHSPTVPSEQQRIRDKRYHRTVITDGVVPVGYPVPDKEVLLLDEDDHEVGINQIGEIVVRRRYLSPGCWRQPELTQVRFLPDPDGGDRRLYRTGDLGRSTRYRTLDMLGGRTAGEA